MAYITETSEKYAIQDIENKCDVNTKQTCLSLGIKGGLIDGNQSRGKFGYSLVDGCGVQHSLDYCYGYILGYNKGYGHQGDNGEIWNTANNKAGYQHGAKPPDQIRAINVAYIIGWRTLKGYKRPI